MCGFKKGVLSERLARKPIRTIAELFDETEEYVQREEDSTRMTEVQALVVPSPYLLHSVPVPLEDPLVFLVATEGLLSILCGPRRRHTVHRAGAKARRAFYSPSSFVSVGIGSGFLMVLMLFAAFLYLTGFLSDSSGGGGGVLSVTQKTTVLNAAGSCRFLRSFLWWLGWRICSRGNLHSHGSIGAIISYVSAKICKWIAVRLVIVKCNPLLDL